MALCERDRPAVQLSVLVPGPAMTSMVQQREPLAESAARYVHVRACVLAWQAHASWPGVAGLPRPVGLERSGRIKGATLEIKAIVEEYEMQFKENTQHKNDYNNILNKSKLHKLSLHAVENQVDKYYNDDNHSFSSALDILASYLKGQKTIYIEAKELSEWRLNSLMLPALILSAAASVGASPEVVERG